MTIKTAFIPLLLFFLLSVKAQSPEIDSLKRSLRHEVPDSSKVETYLALALQYEDQQIDSAMAYARKALLLSQKIKWLPSVGKSFHLIGILNHLKGDYAQCLQDFSKAVEIWEQLEKTGGVPDKEILNRKSSSLGNIGLTYQSQGDFPKALEYFFKSLKIKEEIGDTRGASIALGNIGILYKNQGQYLKALDHYKRALKMDEARDDKKGIARHLGNIGIVYMEQGATAPRDCVDFRNRCFETALDYYTKALRLDESEGNRHGIARHTGNIGNIYREQEKYAKALKYYGLALKLSEEMKNESDRAAWLGNIGSVHFDMALKGTEKSKNLGLAKNYIQRSLEIYYETGSLDGQQEFEKLFSRIDSSLGDFASSFAHYKKYIAAHDSIINGENVKKQTRLEMQFEFGKKQAADSVKVAEEKRVADAELRAERNKSYSLYGGLLLLLVFTVFMYNRFRITQKQKKIIEEQKKIVEEQKQIVEEKQKDILDSIHYAQRIQKSLMPSEKYIERTIGKKRGRS
jgi:tetratricopeptide (TPR) repeat protein